MKIKENSIVKKSKGGILHIVFGRTMIIILLLLIQILNLSLLVLSAKDFILYFFGSITVFNAVFLIFVLNTKANPSIKLTWCFFIAVLPIFGALMYVFVHADIGHRLEKKAVSRTMAEGKNFRPENNEVYLSLKREDKAFYNLSRYLKDTAGFSAYENSSVKYFSDGESYFEDMLAELETAEKFIFLEYFIIKEGVMWDKILDILKQKVQAGVEVRVLYDGTNTVSNLPYSYPEKLRKMGIQCKMFSPLRPFVSTHYNNRDHRKILVIDGICAYTGGINLADEYINVTAPYGYWKDTAVKIKGEAVNGFTLMFLEMWNYNEKNRKYEEYLGKSRASGNGIIIPYGDNPTGDERLGETVYLDLINRAEDYVYIMTPYLIIDNEMETSLKNAAKRGIDVRIILPEKPDHIYAHVLAKDHFSALMAAGVKIYTFSPGFIHAKVFLVDNKYATVGTINLDYRSLYLHFECGLLMYKTLCIKDIFADFINTFEKSHLVNDRDLKKRGVFSRLFGMILKAIAPLM